MIEKYFRKDIVTIEHPSRPEFHTNPKSHRGIILSLLSRLRKDTKTGKTYTPLELFNIFTEALNKYDELKKKTKATVKLHGWKGTSGINVVENPESFLVITYAKADQDSEPEEIKRTITKDELNAVIGAINLLDNGKKINTPKIAEQFCKLRNIEKNNEDKELFNNAIFDWQLFFSDRFLHTELNLCLRVLDFYKVIKYRGGKSQVLKKVLDIQGEL